MTVRSHEPVRIFVPRLGVNEDVVMLGGVGRNPGFVESMRRELNLERIHIPDEPEYGAAVGAAVVAAAEAETGD